MIIKARRDNPPEDFKTLKIKGLVLRIQELEKKLADKVCSGVNEALEIEIKHRDQQLEELKATVEAKAQTIQALCEKLNDKLTPIDQVALAVFSSLPSDTLLFSVQIADAARMAYNFAVFFIAEKAKRSQQ